MTSRATTIKMTLEKGLDGITHPTASINSYFISNCITFSTKILSS